MACGQLKKQVFVPVGQSYEIHGTNGSTESDDLKRLFLTLIFQVKIFNFHLKSPKLPDQPRGFRCTQHRLHTPKECLQSFWSYIIGGNV